jgi:transcriptional regulator with XRE-family HTH domain
VPESNEGQRRRTAEIVRYWMHRRGLTRQLFADRLGKSKSWVDKICNGDRQLDRLSLLRDIARVLDVPLAVFIDHEEAERRQGCPDEHEIDAIRLALRRYDVITDVFRPSGAPLPEPDLASLERRVRHGWMAFQASNYHTIGQLLPQLIQDGQAAVWQLDGDLQRIALARLAWTYQLTAATALKLGDADLGWIAADRGIQVAERTDDPTLICSAARRVAHALSETHQGTDAVGLVRSAARRLTPYLATRQPAFVSAYGMLLLKGSIAAARLQLEADVIELQSEAFDVADRLGADRNENWSAFGRTNVSVHKVSALAEMHAASRVLDAATAIPAADLRQLPRERRASHLLDVTRGYLQVGHREDAANSLLDADLLALEEVRCRRLTREIMTSLVYSYTRGRRPSSAITTLAKAMGVVG